MNSRNCHNHRHQLNHFNHSSDCGFTLVELIVSMTIASVLMVGLSTFFASTFHNMFQAQNENANTERQYAVNQIMADKFGKMEKRLPPSDSDTNFSYNKTDGKTLPFTYMAMVDDNNDTVKDRLAFKDLMLFNKIVKMDASTYAFGDMGTGNSRDNAGKIKNADNGNSIQNYIKFDYVDEGGYHTEMVIKYFAGFAMVNEGGTDYFYITVPDRDLILKCIRGMGAGDYCDNFGNFSGVGGLNMPMDVTFGEGFMFIADSGNNRIIEYKMSDNSIRVISTNLNFPTGLAYYDAGSDGQYLFVADTFNNKIKKIKFLEMNRVSTSTVIGDGESVTCDGTARFCKLNMPTGLYLDKDSPTKALYIADSGNNRILKMSDPGKPDVLKMQFELSDNYALDRIEFKGDWSGGTYDNTMSNLTGSNANYTNAITPITLKTFSNPDRFTVFSATSGDPCESKDGVLYVNEDLGASSYLKAGQYLKMGSSVLKIATNPSAPAPGNCTVVVVLPAFPIVLTKWAIQVTGDLTGATSGMVVYPSNPKGPGADNTIVQINGLSSKWTKTGFVTTEIKTYDTSLAETDYQTTPVGDGILGTEEDSIQILKDGPVFPTLNFPTGVSDVYVADSMGKQILNQTGWSSSTTLNSVNTTFDIGDYDYISDFPIDSIEFKLYNGNKILEATIITAPDPNNASSVSQVYKHDAILK